MIRVTPRARRREDRAGDPLDGLVNLFDLGIVLAVGFLLAALASLKLTTAAIGHRQNGGFQQPSTPIVVSPGQTVQPLPSPGASVAGHGTKVGTVYRLPDGRLVYVTGSTPSPSSAFTTPTPSHSQP